MSRYYKHKIEKTKTGKNIYELNEEELDRLKEDERLYKNLKVNDF